MPQQRMIYWKPATLKRKLSGSKDLDVISSDQFGTVQSGDTVWIVTVIDGLLYGLGKVLVGRVLDQTQAKKLYGRELWPAKYHLEAMRGTGQQIVRRSLQQIADQLVFESKAGRSKLNMVDDKVNPQQMQKMRNLTEESAELIAASMQQKSVRKSADKPRLDAKKPQPAIKKRSPKTSVLANTAEALDILDILSRLQDAGKTSGDLLIGQYRKSDRSQIALNGLCYVLSECMFHLCPGRFTPHRISWGDGSTHWFLKEANGEILETISPRGKKCCKDSEYNSARRAAFFTKQPSKRAVKLLHRAGLHPVISEAANFLTF